MKRQLAAVLAADICDYSRLMGEDSEAMLGALRRLRAEVFGPAVASHRGRIVKSMGDGWIVLFGAASDAVSAAFAIQDGLTRARRVDEPDVLLRVGIHIGDVVEEGEDVFGDGVNVAARVEQSAVPGTVAISESVYGGIDSTLRPSFDPVGAWELKNIDWTVRVWVREPPPPEPPSSSDETRLKLVVRPVETSDTRAEMREMADAITGDLGKYLNVEMWISTAVSDQTGGAEYALSGRLRGQGDRVRLEAQLTDASGKALFQNSYDSDLADAFDWQDRVGAELAGRTISAVYDVEREKLLRRDVDDLTAAECLLRAQIESRLDPAGLDKTLDLVRMALKKDPQFPDAMTQFLMHVAAKEAIPVALNDELEHWCRAAEPYFSDYPLLEYIASALASTVLGMETKLDRHGALDRCMRRAPNDLGVLVWGGFAYLFLGDPEKAMGCFQKSQALGGNTPWSTSIANGIAMVHLQQGRFDQAIAHASAVLAAAPDYPPPMRMLAAALAQSGRIEEAKEALDRLFALDPDASIRKLQGHTPYDDTPETRRYLDGLRMAGLPD